MILLVALVPTGCCCAQVSGATPATPSTQAARPDASETSADDASGAVPAVTRVARAGPDPKSLSDNESLRVSWGQWVPKLPLLGLLPLREGGRCFRWRAALDAGTGIASSKESSIVPSTSPLHRRVVPVLREAAGATSTGATTATSSAGNDNADDSRDTEELQGREDDSMLLRWVEHWAQQYPTWLCSGWVTGGLLRAAVTGPSTGSSSSKKKKNQPRQGTVEIRTTIGNWHLLTFGSCQLSQRVTYRETLTSVAGAGTGGTGTGTGTGDAGHVLTSHCTVVLPVTGGILALHSPPHGRNDSARKGGGAALLFSVKKQRQVCEAVAATEPGHGRASRTPSDSPWRLQLSSAVAGYRPALAGTSLPIPMWRKTLYLHTQAVMHAYVMWRFHRFGWSGGGREP
jgi:hypothetical protein